MALSDGSWRMAGGGGKRLEAILANEVANGGQRDGGQIERQRLNGGGSCGAGTTGEGTGEGDGDGDKKSVRREDEAAALRPISSMANRPGVNDGPPEKEKLKKRKIKKKKNLL
jgi:hypothetical protein